MLNQPETFAAKPTWMEKGPSARSAPRRRGVIVTASSLLPRRIDASESMRVVLFADLHLDTPFAWASPEVARRRRQRLREVIARVGALANEGKAEPTASP